MIDRYYGYYSDKAVRRMRKITWAKAHAPAAASPSRLLVRFILRNRMSDCFYWHTFQHNVAFYFYQVIILLLRFYVYSGPLGHVSSLVPFCVARNADLYIVCVRVYYFVAKKCYMALLFILEAKLALLMELTRVTSREPSTNSTCWNISCGHTRRTVTIAYR